MSAEKKMEKTSVGIWRVFAVVASADADDFVHDGCVRRLAPEAVSRRKAYNDAMAWLFTEKENPDLWMLKGSTTRDSDGHLH